jgi:protein KRI1
VSLIKIIYSRYLDVVVEEKYSKFKRPLAKSADKEYHGDNSEEDEESDSDSEDDEEEDEVGELITPEVDAQILKTISSIRAKEEKIYNPETNFFSGSCNLFLLYNEEGKV